MYPPVRGALQSTPAPLVASPYNEISPVAVSLMA
jgi:hypothetical protein